MEAWLVLYMDSDPQLYHRGSVVPLWSLRSGVLVSEALSNIYPDRFQQLRSRMRAGSEESWIFMKGNLRRILISINSYFRQQLGVCLLQSRIPDILRIARDVDRTELNKLVDLLLGCAITCKGRRDHIERILQMQPQQKSEVMLRLRSLDLEMGVLQVNKLYRNPSIRDSVLQLYTSNNSLDQSKPIRKQHFDVDNNSHCIKSNKNGNEKTIHNNNKSSSNNINNYNRNNINSSRNNININNYNSNNNSSNSNISNCNNNKNKSSNNNINSSNNKINFYNRSTNNVNSNRDINAKNSYDSDVCQLSELGYNFTEVEKDKEVYCPKDKEVYCPKDREVFCPKDEEVYCPKDKEVYYPKDREAYFPKDNKAYCSKENNTMERTHVRRKKEEKYNETEGEMKKIGANYLETSFDEEVPVTLSDGLPRPCEEQAFQMEPKYRSSEVCDVDAALAGDDVAEEANISTQYADLERVVSKLEERAKELLNKDVIIHTLNTKIEKLQQGKQTAQKRASELVSRITELRNLISALSAEMLQQRQDLDNANLRTEEVESLKNEIERLLQGNRKLVEENLLLKKRLDNLEDGLRLKEALEAGPLTASLSLERDRDLDSTWMPYQECGASQSESSGLGSSLSGYSTPTSSRSPSPGNTSSKCSFPHFRQSYSAH